MPDERRWNRWWVWWWWALISVMVGSELFALFTGRNLRDGEDPTLTEVIVERVPWWVTIPFLGWLLVHLTSRLANRKHRDIL